jgi:hypothetical protein
MGDSPACCWVCVSATLGPLGLRCGLSGELVEPEATCDRVLAKEKNDDE